MWVFLVPSVMGARYDLGFFEASVLPRWLELFSIDWDRGVFSLSPYGEPDLYGSLDVLHILWTVGQVDRLDEATRDDWKATIDAISIRRARPSTVPRRGKRGRLFGAHRSASCMAKCRLRGHGEIGQLERHL